MPIFVERFVLPALAALFILLFATNPMGFDPIQRISGSIAVVFIAFFCAYSLHRANKEPLLSAQIEGMAGSPAKNYKSKSAAPEFKVSLLGARGIIPDFDKSMTGFQLAVQVVNSGTTGIVANWYLEARLPDGTILKSSPATIGAKAPTEKEGAAYLNWTDLNVNKLSVRTGDSERGELFFYFKVPSVEIEKPDTLLVLIGEDAFGNRFRTEQRLGDWTQQKMH